MSDSALDVEIELIESSLLPAEHLETSLDNGTRTISISSQDSDLNIRVTIAVVTYPTAESVKVEIRGANDGRDEAEGWRQWVSERMKDWSTEDEYPLFQILTDELLPLLAPTTAPSSPKQPHQEATSAKENDEKPHHVLLTSHHLIAPSKRKDLNSLSSQLSLAGFAKTGHPGIMYAIGSRSDLVEWLREVKSWQWLALRVRISPEPIEEEESGGRGKESGARGGRGRGEWVELEKVGEAVEWMRKRGREKMLTDLGMGVGA